MAQPRFVINRMGKTIDVYNYSGSIGGRILNNECYVMRGDVNGTWSFDIYYYNAAAGGWKTGRVSYQDASHTYAYSKDLAEAVTSSGAQFLIRDGMRCRNYQGTTWIDSIYGSKRDRIKTNGASYAGMPYPDRLKISEYRKNGIWIKKNDLWCDTDILFGYPTRPTVYSSKMP